MLPDGEGAEEVVDPATPEGGDETPPEGGEAGGAPEDAGGDSDGDGGDDTPPEGDDGDPPEERKFTQKDVDRFMNEDKKRYRRDNSDLREEVARLKGVEEGRNQVNPPGPPEAEVQPPKEEEFETVEAYHEALFNYRWDQKEKERDAKESTKTSEQTEVQRVEEASKVYTEKLTDFQKEHSDFYEVVGREYRDGGPCVTKTMFETIRDAGVPEVAYFLGNHREESERISDLPPSVQVIEIGRLAGKLEAGSPAPSTPGAPPAAPVKPGTQAPAVPGVVKGTRGGGKKDYSKMSPEEYADVRNKEEEAKKRKK